MCVDFFLLKTWPLLISCPENSRQVKGREQKGKSKEVIPILRTKTAGEVCPNEREGVVRIKRRLSVFLGVRSKAHLIVLLFDVPDGQLYLPFFFRF